mmetsp:Transcript_23383/g.69021  ORF Transcript_23383/g.69021 Transcript_23383/m.69021 type:complete len:291 (+) Transcript_23383:167-1039(+)
MATPALAICPPGAAPTAHRAARRPPRQCSRSPRRRARRPSALAALPLRVLQQRRPLAALLVLLRRDLGVRRAKQRQPRPLAEQRRARAVDGRAARATPPHPRRCFVDDEAEADGGDDREAAAGGDHQRLHPRLLEQPPAHHRPKDLPEPVDGAGQALHHPLLHRHVREERRDARHGQPVPQRDEPEAGDEGGDRGDGRKARVAERCACHGQHERALLAQGPVNDAHEHALHEHASHAHRRDGEPNLLWPKVERLLAQVREVGLVRREGEAEEEVEREQRHHVELCKVHQQ